MLMIWASAHGDATTRSWQPLVLKGRQLGQLLGSKETSLEVLAIHNGKLVPIPFQVDEILPDGKFVLPNGPEPVAPDNPGILDRYDEVAMMICDLGKRADKGVALPPGALEVDLNDPLGGPDRYAYIASVASPLRSPVRYIYYDATTDTVESDFYRMRLSHGWPSYFALLNHVGQPAANLIDRFKVRTTATILGLFNFHINEDDIHNRLLAWKIGPVRLIRRERHSVRLLLGIHSPAVTSMVFFYRNFLVNPTKVSFPWIPRLIFTRVDVRADVDYIHLRDFELMWSGMHQPPIMVGSGSPAEIALEDADPPPLANWIALRGYGHLMVQTFKPTPALALIQKRLYYRYSSKPDPPETYPGQYPGVGLITTGWRNLSSGTHIIDSYFVIAPGDYSPSALVRELSVQPTVTIKPTDPTTQKK